MDCLSVWLAGILLVISCLPCLVLSSLVFLTLPCTVSPVLSSLALPYTAFSISVFSYYPLTFLLLLLLHHLFHRTLNVTYTRPKEKQCSTDLKKRNGQVNMMRTTTMIWRLLIVTKAVRRPYVPWSPIRCPSAPP
jgi:membrane protein implicated in regulation of membrane protease activity